MTRHDPSTFLDRRTDEGAPQQLELLRAAARGRRPRPEPGLAPVLPVARVAVDVQPAHLDRPFDYAVPADLADQAAPGVRVRVRFAGQDVDGFVLDRAEASDHPGTLTPLRRVVSPEPVLTPAVLALCRAVADRYAGTLADVLRLAVPPRHARTEREPPQPPADHANPRGAPPPVHPLKNPADHDALWGAYPAGAAFLARVRAGDGPRAVWTAPPGPAWADAVADAVDAAVQGGRGALVVVPDRRDLDLAGAALTARLHVPVARLEADLGPTARYRAFLAALRGTAPVVLGTRAAAFAPVARLGLVALWDDGDDQHAEPRAPYPHAREVLALRAELEGAAFLLGGWSWTAEGAALVEAGWARPLEPDRSGRRRVWPRVRPAADGPADPLAAAARIPTPAWRAAHDALPHGSVLVQVPHTGYLPGVACATCRAPARCPACAGPLRLRDAYDAAGPVCGWCGRVWPAWTCPHCEGRRLRATRTGVERTAEELGRAFPGATVVVSRADRNLPAVPATGALVLATPGVEPFAPGGYAAALLLDGDALLARPDLRAGEEALRRWRNAAALVRPAEAGGVVVLAADPSAPSVQALVRGDPAGYAARELAERRELRLPPGAVVASVTGDAAAVAAFVAELDLPPGTSVLGPVPVPAPTGRPRVAGAAEQTRMLLQAGSPARAELTSALRDALAVRSARRDAGAVRVRVDPRDIG